MDPVSDMIVSVKNAYLAQKEQVILPYSKLKFEVAKALERAGFVGKVQKSEDKITVDLIYVDNKPRMSEIKRVSKPGLRVYVKSKKIQLIKGGRGTYLISTPQGIMTSAEAKKKNLGGEVICLVW